MGHKLMYITNNIEMAKIVDESDVDWIFIDLEINGKIQRQGGMDTVISSHHINDVKKIKNVLKKTEILVRINPISESSETEINKVIDYGADIIMLPYFKKVTEVERFMQLVDERVKTCLLVETKEAVECLDEILEIPNIDYIHIGLNDLHLSYNLNFMFEPLVNGIVEEIVRKIKCKNIQFGIGGIAKLGEGMVPADKILMEHYRLQSSMAILSRSFYSYDKCFEIEKIQKEYIELVDDIREFEKEITKSSIEVMEDNYRELKVLISKIVEEKEGRNI